MLSYILFTPSFIHGQYASPLQEHILQRNWIQSFYIYLLQLCIRKLGPPLYLIVPFLKMLYFCPQFDLYVELTLTLIHFLISVRLRTSLLQISFVLYVKCFSIFMILKKWWEQIRNSLGHHVYHEFCLLNSHQDS